MTKEEKIAEELKEVARVAAIELRSEARQLALEIVDHAKEEARNLLVAQGLDLSKIPLICNDIRWIKRIGGVMGTIIVGLLIDILLKK